jgi:transcriptional regulator with XRE-family HTH domain
MRKARREEGLSQRELSEKMDIHRNTIIRWESKVSEPSPVQAEALAQALNQTVDFFYTSPEPIAAPKNLSSEWTKKTPLTRLQQLTPEAMVRLCRALGITTVEVARTLRVPHTVVKDWSMGRSAPNMDELNLLRAAYGEEFDPTPSLARKATHSIANRLDRMEKTLFKIYAALKKAGLIDEVNS